MKTVVFAGPSIYGVDRQQFDRMEFRAPAAAGDILRCINEGATAIGLIDGYFGDRPAVWHKELLFALSRGIVVAGASSMGALRAAECASFGMLGFGAVYAEYASGFRVSDADVAIGHAPEEMNFMPTSVAMVDLEATLDALRAEFSRNDRHQLIEAGRRLHFLERTWPAVVSAAGLGSVHLKKIMENERSIKRDDALLLLNWLQSQVFASVGNTPVWQFQNTAFFQRLSTSPQTVMSI
jgi:hypothetical protein